MAVVLTAILIPLAVLAIRTQRSSAAATTGREAEIAHLETEITRRLQHFSRSFGTARSVDSLLMLNGLHELADPPKAAVVRSEYADDGLVSLFSRLCDLLPGDNEADLGRRAALALEDTLSRKLALLLDPPSNIRRTLGLALLAVEINQQIGALNIDRWRKPFENVVFDSFVPVPEETNSRLEDAILGR